jgi:AraC-like DNA-binding protein
MNLHFVQVELGKVEILENLSQSEISILKEKLQDVGLDLLDDKRSILIENVKNIISNLLSQTNSIEKQNYSKLISERSGFDYTYISNLFSEINGFTIQQFIISQKIEQVKELIVYNEFSLTQIADRLNYSSVAHLSSQFKKNTGMSPTYFKHLNRCKFES